MNILKYISEQSGKTDFSGLRILVLHSGGDAKRTPQYSACGKIFSPVPRLLPDGRRSTLFDEFIINLSGIPSRMGDGMLVCSGDVLLLFNSLQLDAAGSGAAVLSIKEPVSTGKITAFSSEARTAMCGVFCTSSRKNGFQSLALSIKPVRSIWIPALFCSAGTC